jgi:cell filamentation protein
MTSFSSQHKDPYCYENTQILINKKNIRDQDKLDKFERLYTAKRLYELNKKPIKGEFDLDHLKDIHRYIFQDIYDFAGKVRTVNIGKGIQFCPVPQIEPYFQYAVTERLKGLNYLNELNYKGFSETAAEIFAEVNIVHPFRDGNGRTQREFFRNLAIVNGFNINWEYINNQEMIQASKQSAIGSTKGLVEIFTKVLEG